MNRKKRQVNSKVTVKHYIRFIKTIAKAGFLGFLLARLWIVYGGANAGVAITVGFVFSILAIYFTVRTAHIAMHKYFCNLKSSRLQLKMTWEMRMSFTLLCLFLLVQLIIFSEIILGKSRVPTTVMVLNLVLITYAISTLLLLFKNYRTGFILLTVFLVGTIYSVSVQLWYSISGVNFTVALLMFVLDWMLIIRLISRGRKNGFYPREVI